MQESLLPRSFQRLVNLVFFCLFVVDLGEVGMILINEVNYVVIT